MSANKPKLLIIPGDGIGHEVIPQATRVVNWFADNRKIAFDISEGELGVGSYNKHGKTMLPDATLEKSFKSDAILFGAIGGDGYEDIPIDVRRETGLLALRRKLGLFANLRPVVAYDELLDASTLKPEVIKGVDMIIVRELSSGIYFGEPRGIEDLGNGVRRGYNTMSYTTPEIHRVLRISFELARARRNRLCSIEKSNVLETSKLWREEARKIAREEYPDVEFKELIVDAGSMELIRNPKQFDIIVTGNMFGDILSDAAAMLTGSLGMLPSASLSEPDKNGRRNAFYEPVHGAAPDIAGRNIANPLAAILSFAMALRHTFETPDEADLLERAVRDTVARGVRTADIKGTATRAVSTRQMGDAVIESLDRLNA
ncbi:MAG: 3-isopropylmalate dehydrogenase [Alphaproteobacteria bacterium]|nr:3-isopropylmalate dehydrogenase [Alphaproteobacteria bacterium]